MNRLTVPCYRSSNRRLVVHWCLSDLLQSFFGLLDEFIAIFVSIFTGTS
jgi:hypothetical protein